MSLKNKRKSSIATVTKLINSITDLIDQKADINDISNFDKSLEEQIQNIRDLTSQIIKNELNENITQSELDNCTEQEFRIISQTTR